IEYSKVGNIEVLYTDNKNKLKYNSNMSNLRDSETMISLRNEESEEEKFALDKVFDYIKEDKDTYELIRFGIDNNIFIIEFNLHSTYDDIYNKKMSNELHELISKNENSVKYIANQEVKVMKVIFNKGINVTEPIIFEYKMD